LADLLEEGAAFLEDQRHRHMSRAVTYQRGAQSKELLATIGRTEFEQADDAGLIHRTQSRDFLIRTADIDLGAGPTLPLGGDRVREEVDGKVFVYEVNAPGGQPPWRYSDPFRKTLRIHTKHVDTEVS